ncbi:hypothetical protein [Streptomyces canus]|uniref:hypothetical protein n=1 Tax=Streptomyces canus TaxID=58343 RepID=UPI0036ECB1A3
MQDGQPDAGAAAPRRTLPGGRSSPAQQINTVLGLAFLTEHTGEVEVQRGRLAQHAGRSPATVGECMAFLADVGLVRAGRGRYAVTDHGRAFAQLWPRDSARARLVLRPLLQAHWSGTAAGRYLADGPLPQEQLAKRLRAGLPGVPLRGMYLVEWLVIGLVLVRDEQLRVHLAPPDGVPPTAGPGAGPGTDEAPEQTAEQPAAPQPDERDRREERHQRRAPGEDLAEGAAGTTLLGLTRREVQALPDARYAAFLEGVLLSLRGALAPPA